MVTLYIRDDIIGLNRTEEMPVSPGGMYGMQLMEKLVPSPQFLGLWNFYRWDRELGEIYGPPILPTDWVLVAEGDAFGAVNSAAA